MLGHRFVIVKPTRGSRSFHDYVIMSSWLLLYMHARARFDGRLDRETTRVHKNELRWKPFVAWFLFALDLYVTFHERFIYFLCFMNVFLLIILWLMLFVFLLLPTRASGGVKLVLTFSLLLCNSATHPLDDISGHEWQRLYDIEAKWCHIIASWILATLFQEMAWSHRAPSHYINQWWLILLIGSIEINFIAIVNEIQNFSLKKIAFANALCKTLSRPQCVKSVVKTTEYWLTVS